MAESSVQDCTKRVVQQLGWAKRGVQHPHVAPQFRDPSLEAGVKLRLIQKYLGHSSLLTTTVYLHLTTQGEGQRRAAMGQLLT